MILLGLFLLLALGVVSSVFFSGTETGFYRVTRVRLVLDGYSGSWVARGLLWFTNHPAMFVATTLIGNNLANYLTSLAVVLITERLVHHPAAELIIPIVCSPLIFVYCELLPKRFFFQAPNRLLKLAGPFFLLFSLLSLPVSIVLGGLGRILEIFLGQSPAQVRLRLARSELLDVLEEGHESGILRPVQHRLAQGLFAVANQSIVRYCLPVARVPMLPAGASRGELLRLARRHRWPLVLLADRQNRRPTGYVRVIDMYLTPETTEPPVRPLAELPSTATHIEALTQMQTEKEPVALVVDSPAGKIRGVVVENQLLEPLLQPRK